MSEERYQFPIPHGWYGIGFSAELAIGEVRPLKYFGQDIVLYRGEDGIAHVSEAHCPHLGAHVGHGGEVVGNNIRCPFHHWQFDGEGKADHIPYAKNIPPRAQKKGCLFQYPVVEANRVIWVWYHPERIAPLFPVVKHPEFEEHDDEWTEFQSFTWEIPTTVQETAENAADLAHFLYVHNSAEMPEGEVVYDGPQRAARFDMRTPAMNEDGTMSEVDFIDSVLETANNGPGQTWQTFSGIFYTMMIGLITPIDGQNMSMTFAFTHRKGQTEEQEIMANGMRDQITSGVEEDIPIWRHKIYQEKPILCDGDGPIAQYRKWFKRFYDESPDNHS
ncbi:phenylpropionate dioxygenase-like ring-hydroxylating dioxygenase large terminal subunit [Sinobacterium caligoides]|uniref:cholesterol 7-desaturase n=1 Tax=Sinobacterium caligoides TaxID=933926 RepID=A0A3N2DH24_9GAMM|nr:Rieske 2Fe-2S domain-containing protein [Sinobacterium caligoides]ROR99059.1 phenylpropionate dioxygenase-like ring-hydroxylating dioxygenase large terminal subunit [Sinobacterium caligoides]